ncbi:extracellular solute-binding protein [Sediminibacillus terrae]|uniref:extracellular solute-binding protein n=1 Tax=Sediminibacillus terrae TaxID=1562106 RepID=UPI001296BF98|nr:extracellular solute-binding protein [Sediminibacillus terrae]
MKNALLLISIVVVIFLGFALYRLKPSDLLISESNPEQEMFVWVYTEALAEAAKNYENTQQDLGVNVRRFTNGDDLIEELKIAVSNGGEPDIAEIPSFYGIHSLIEAEAVVPIDEFITNSFRSDLAKVITERYKHQGKLYALPIGYEVPLVYMNESRVKKRKRDASYASFKAIVQEAETAKTSEEAAWKLHTDLMFPWYMINTMKEKQPHTIKPDDFLKTDWGAARLNDQLMPSFAYQLALTDFVNGKGAILLSSSRNLLLVDRLIGNTFDWEVFEFPPISDEMLVNGSGLAVMDNQGKGMVSAFLAFLQEKDALAAIGLEETLIPADRSLAGSTAFLNQYRRFPHFQDGVEHSLEWNGVTANREDLIFWDQLKRLNQKMNEMERSR